MVPLAWPLLNSIKCQNHSVPGIICKVKRLLCLRDLNLRLVWCDEINENFMERWKKTAPFNVFTCSDFQRLSAAHKWGCLGQLGLCKFTQEKWLKILSLWEDLYLSSVRWASSSGSFEVGGREMERRQKQREERRSHTPLLFIAPSLFLRSVLHGSWKISH